MAFLIKLIYKDQIDQAINSLGTVGTFKKSDHSALEKAVNTLFQEKLNWTGAIFERFSKQAIRSTLKDRVKSHKEGNVQALLKAIQGHPTVNKWLPLAKTKALTNSAVSKIAIELQEKPEIASFEVYEIVFIIKLAQSTPTIFNSENLNFSAIHKTAKNEVKDFKKDLQYLFDTFAKEFGISRKDCEKEIAYSYLINKGKKSISSNADYKTEIEKITADAAKQVNNDPQFVKSTLEMIIKSSNFEALAKLYTYTDLLWLYAQPNSANRTASINNIIKRITDDACDKTYYFTNRQIQENIETACVTKIKIPNVDKTLKKTTKAIPGIEPKEITAHYNDAADTQRTDLPPLPFTQSTIETSIVIDDVMNHNLNTSNNAFFGHLLEWQNSLS